MVYRLLIALGGVLVVAALYGVLWFLSRKFLMRHGVTDQLEDRSTVLATWTFAGISVGLVFVGVGAFVLGPWAFYRTLRGHNVPIDDGAAVLWGFVIVAASLILTLGSFLGFLWIVGAY